MRRTANEGIKAALSLYHIGYDEICRRLGITEKCFTWLLEKEFIKSMRHRPKDKEGITSDSNNEKS